MKILVDHHHGALLRSMYYLFNKRLGHEVLVPTGMEWLDHDRLYSIYPNRETSDQMLNSWKNTKYSDMFTPITLQEFLDRNDIDVIVASLWENHVIFDEIIKKYNKKIKLVLQAGNNILREHVQMTNGRNLLSSAYPTFVTTPNINKVFYHQEFSLEKFKPEPNCNIKSVVNYKHIMEDDMNIILQLEKELPDWEFKCYGAHNRDGFINDDEDSMSNSMKKFGFVFHVKKDDGYGHVIHNSFACGKPMIVNLHTAGVPRDGMFIRNTASFLYENFGTIIDSIQPIQCISLTLRHMADNYERYSTHVYKKFNEVVNFEQESIQVKTFLENLV